MGRHAISLRFRSAWQRRVNGAARVRRPKDAGPSVTFARSSLSRSRSDCHVTGCTLASWPALWLRGGRDSNPREGVGDNLRRHATLHANAWKFLLEMVRIALSAGARGSTSVERYWAGFGQWTGSAIVDEQRSTDQLHRKRETGWILFSISMGLRSPRSRLDVLEIGHAPICPIDSSVLESGRDQRMPICRDPQQVRMPCWHFPMGPGNGHFVRRSSG